MRSSGVLMHISSLPSPYGIGTMGKEARKFVDFLKESGQTYWQVLPMGPTGYGDSPYQSYSAFAGNPYFVDLEELVEEKLLTREECESYNWGDDEEAVDYGWLYHNRFELFAKVLPRFLERLPKDYENFCEEQSEWLPDYALFMALKKNNSGMSWTGWDVDIKHRKKEAIDLVREELKDDISLFQMIQYFFFRQWNALKKYANENGIKIIGDTPIYVAWDSADVWADPSQFYLDEELHPIEVAGCPPDAFSEDGQLWGNPLFNWNRMKEDGYSWWIKRIGMMAKLFDVIRIDHFRGFDTYYAIPFGDTTAKNGHWFQGPGMDLFRALENALGRLDIIAEDLGALFDSVWKLLDDSGFPGMKVLQFAFGNREDESAYVPHNHKKNCVVYTGTHDNETILGWMENASDYSREYAIEYLRLSEEEGYNWGMMKAAWSSVADRAVVTMQDLLGLGNESRMNTPSSQGNNWKWRMKRDAIDSSLSAKIRQNMKLYGRLPR